MKCQINVNGFTPCVILGYCNYLSQKGISYNMLIRYEHAITPYFPHLKYAFSNTLKILK